MIQGEKGHTFHVLGLREHEMRSNPCISWG